MARTVVPQTNTGNAIKSPVVVSDTDNEENLFDLFSDEEDFSFDEDSNEIKVKGKRQSAQAGTGIHDESDEVELSDDGGVDSDDVSNPSTAYENRIANLESSFQSFQNKVIDLLKQVPTALAQNQGQQVEDEDFDVGDSKTLKNFIQTEIRNAVSSALQPMQATQQQQQYTNEYTQLAAMHGKDFIDRLPIIKDLMVDDSGNHTGLSFTRAYQIARKASKSANPNGVNPQKKTGQASALRDKANGLRTESGVTASKKPQSGAKTIREAFEAALEELTGD